jgi:hypothetical protein
MLCASSLLLHQTLMRSVCKLSRQLVFGSGAAVAEPRLHSKDSTQSGIQRRYRPVTPVETGGACRGLEPPDAMQLVRALGGLRHGHRKACLSAEKDTGGIIRVKTTTVLEYDQGADYFTTI